MGGGTLDQALTNKLSLKVSLKKGLVCVCCLLLQYGHYITGVSLFRVDEFVKFDEKLPKSYCIDGKYH